MGLKLDIAIERKIVGWLQIKARHRRLIHRVTVKRLVGWIGIIVICLTVVNIIFSLQKEQELKFFSDTKSQALNDCGEDAHCILMVTKHFDDCIEGNYSSYKNKKFGRSFVFNPDGFHACIAQYEKRAMDTVDLKASTYTARAKKIAAILNEYDIEVRTQNTLYLSDEKTLRDILARQYKIDDITEYFNSPDELPPESLISILVPERLAKVEIHPFFETELERKMVYYADLLKEIARTTQGEWVIDNLRIQYVPEILKADMPGFDTRITFNSFNQEFTWTYITGASLIDFTVFDNLKALGEQYLSGEFYINLEDNKYFEVVYLPKELASRLSVST